LSGSDQLRVEIDSDDGPVATDELGREQRHVAGPGPDVEHLHPARDAGVHQKSRRVRREHLCLQPQAFGLRSRLTE
jgi:hypothetical protein